MHTFIIVTGNYLHKNKLILFYFSEEKNVHKIAVPVDQFDVDGWYQVFAMKMFKY
jgi:hypothetical protein